MILGKLGGGCDYRQGNSEPPADVALGGVCFLERNSKTIKEVSLS